MSFKAKAHKTKSLSGINFTKMSSSEVANLFQKTLGGGMHGLCMSPYEEGQEPGDELTEEQVRRRLMIMRPYTKWVRSFSCTEGNELVAKVATELGMKTMVGAWLGPDEAKNEKEIAGLIQLAKDGYVDIAAVGNEVLYRNDLSAAQLLNHLRTVRAAIPTNIQIGYVDAYYEFTLHPDIVAACDVILANCYPYWEGCGLEHSLVYMKQMYQQAVNAGGGKKVIITETGWPSKGEAFEGAHPSEVNAMAYYINAQQWAEQDGIELFYFSSFDESWKVGAEGDVGAYWGLWDKDEQLKYQ